MITKRKRGSTPPFFNTYQPRGIYFNEEATLHKRLKMFSTELKRKGYSSGKDWTHLEGNLITCPLCGRDAIILSSAWCLPLKLFKAFCHCTINTETADFSYHWCRERDKHRIRNGSANPLLFDAWWKSTRLDVTTFFKSHLAIGHIF